MWQDPIIEELHKFREEHAARFNYDLDAIIKDLQESERLSNRQKVSFPKYTLPPSPCSLWKKEQE